MRREGDPPRGRALARGRREGGRRHGRRHATLGATARRLVAGGLGVGSDVRLRLRRLRRERRLRERARGARDRRAADGLVRDLGRPGLERRAAVRRRDRRLPGARRVIEKLAALAASGGRAVLFTVVEGDGVGGKLLVVERGDVTGDGPGELADLADEVQRGGRNRLLELDGRKVFAEVYGPPPRLLVYGAVD